MRRWLKWLLLSLGALLLLVALLVTFALNSEYALRRGLAFAAPLIPDSLEYREVNGTLAGRIELVDVRYRVAGTEVVAERLTFSPSLLPLIGRRIELGAVEARRLVVTLPAPDPEADEDAAPPDPRRIIESLRLPVAIQADSVAIDGLAIARADETVLALDALRLSLEWTDAFMDIRALEINGKEISLRGDAHLALAGNEHTRLAIEGSTSLLPWPLAASLAAEGNLAALDVNGRLQEPFGAQLSGRLADVLEGIRWQGQLAIPELVPATFGEGLADSPWRIDAAFAGGLDDTRIELDAEGAWPPAGDARVNLEALVNRERARIERLGVTSSAFGATLNANGNIVFEGLEYQASGGFDHFAWPELSAYALRDGEFRLRGNAELLQARLTAAAGDNDKGSLSLDAVLTFPDLFDAQLRAAGLALDAGGQPLQLAFADITARGIPDDYELEISLEGEYGGRTPAVLHAGAQGNRRGIKAGIQRLEWLGGEAKGSLALDWHQALELQAALGSEGFELARLDPRLDAELGANFKLAARLDEAPDVRIEIDSISGHWQGAPLSGHGELRLVNRELAPSALALQAGSSRLSVRGEAERLAVDLDALLAELHPEAEGRLSLQGELRGPLAEPDVNATLRGDQLYFAGTRIGELAIEADVQRLGLANSTFAVRAREIDSGAFAASHVNFDLEGSRGDHAARLAIEGTAGTLTAAVGGGWDGKMWQGRFRQLQAVYADETWSLQEQPGSIRLHANGDIFFPAHCVAASGQACFGPVEREGERLLARARLEALPLAHLSAWLPGLGSQGIELEGLLDGSVALDGEGPNLRGELALATGEGRIEAAEQDADVHLTGWRSAALHARLADRAIDTDLEILLAEGGFLRGGGRLEMPEEAPATVDARLRAESDDLSIIPLLIPELSDVRGKLEADLRLRGRLDEPHILGRARLLEASATVLALGTRWQNINFQLIGTGRRLRLEGHVESGQGAIDIALAGRDNEGRFAGTATIRGENFKAVHTPEADVDISPALELQLDGSRLTLGGEVLVPRARITPRQIAGAVTPSADQVIVSEGEEEQAQAQEGLRTQVRVTTRLGKDVRVDAFGLQARVEGDLTVSQDGRNPATGTGRLRVAEGRYRAYGQDLTLERGEIIYSGQLLTNPGLDIRAVREATPEVTAGVLVRGPLAEPRVTVFSEPSLPETEALSYLLFGRSLNDATSAEEQQINNTALALALGGQKLLGRVGEKLGVEEVRVERAADSEQAALVLGKYLSPDLYVSYGIGLQEAVNTFQIRYRLSSKWTLEAVSGLKSSADLVYTIER